MKRSISLKKRSVHPYFTTQSNDIVSNYIKKYSKKNDIVLDPFVGSGITLLESRLLKRHSIGIDLSFLACEISKLSTTKFKFIQNIEKDYEKLKDDTLVKIKKVYNNQNIKYSKKYFHNLLLPKNSDVKYVKELFSKKNFISLNILINDIHLLRNMDSKLFFRQIFSGILHRATKTFFYDKLKWGGGNSSIFTKYRYWIPKKPDERNVAELFNIRFKRIFSVIKKTNHLFPNNYQPKIYNKSSTNITFIKSNSIDYVYSDPPYGANINYLDLSTLWYAWLFKINKFYSSKKYEVSEGGDVRNDRNQYLKLLRKNFKEIYRVLKTNKYFSLAFSHKDISLWQYLIDDLNLIGFDYKKTDYFPSFYQSYHKVNNKKSVLTGQMVITFCKSKNRKKRKNRKIVKSNLVLEDFVLKEINSFLKNKKLSLEEIITKLIPVLLERGYNLKNTKIINIVNILNKNFIYNKNNNLWKKKSIKI